MALYQPFLDHLNSLVKGKSVVLVGPSTSSETDTPTSVYEEADIVVRINTDIIYDRERHAATTARADILFLNGSLNHELKKYSLIEPNIVFSHMPNRYKGYGFNIHNTHFNRSNKYFITKYGIKWPTTGFKAIYYLLLTGLKSLHITGFTFFNKDSDGREYHKNYKRKPSDGVAVDGRVPEKYWQRTVHRPQSELDTFKTLLPDSRITMDKTLQELINERP